MRYARFAIPALVLSLFIGFVLPDFGASVTPGFTGFLTAIASGIVLAFVYHGYRRIEPWLIAKTSRGPVRPEMAFYGGLAMTSLLTGVALFLLSPAVFVVPSVAAALQAGLWLALVGLALTPPSDVLALGTRTQPEVTDSNQNDGATAVDTEQAQADAVDTGTTPAPTSGAAQPLVSRSDAQPDGQRTFHLMSDRVTDEPAAGADSDAAATQAEPHSEGPGSSIEHDDKRGEALDVQRTSDRDVDGAKPELDVIRGEGGNDGSADRTGLDVRRDG